MPSLEIVRKKHSFLLSTVLPSQSTVLTSMRNKVQLVDIGVKYLVENVANNNKRLVITSCNFIPCVIHMGKHNECYDTTAVHVRSSVWFTLCQRD